MFFAPYVTVCRSPGLAVIGLGSRQIIRVRPGLEDVHHVADAVAACVHGRGASGHKSSCPYFFSRFMMPRHALNASSGQRLSFHAFALLYRQAVVVPVQRHVTVALDGGHSPLPHLIAVCRQRSQSVPLDRIEKLTAGFPAPGQIARIELFQRPEDCPVERLQVMEHHSLKIDIHGPAHQLDRVFHKSLVPGVPYPGRNHGAPVMLGKGLEVSIDHGLVAVAARDRRLQVVRHNGARGASVKTDGVLACLYQILLFLRAHCLAVCAVAARKYRHEHLDLSYPGCCLIDYFQLLLSAKP